MHDGSDPMGINLQCIAASFIGEGQTSTIFCILSSV